MSLWRELRRRHIFRIAAVYAATGWLVLQLGAIVFPALRAPEWALPILIGFVALGFPVALVLAWAFEVTPEGVRRTAPAEEPGRRQLEARRRVARTLNAAIIVVLAAAVGVLAWRLTGERGAPAPPVPLTASGPATTAGAPATTVPVNSIVVLPFLNLSPRGELEYFAEGVSEQLLDGLAETTDLKVVARTSALQFKGKPADIREIGKALDVHYVLDGSVRRDGDQVRISVQLIDARTGYQEWSHTYQRTVGGVFQIEDEITRAVAATLKVKVASGVARTLANPPANTGAYDEYLLGRQLLNQRYAASERAALVHFKRATELDPQYGPAFAHVAIVYMLLRRSSSGDYSPEEALKSARPFLERAVALAPDAPSTQAAQGWYLWLSAGPEAALPHFERAAQENPAYMDAVNWWMATLDQVGRYREAWAATQAAVHRDPLNFVVNFNYMHGLLLRRRFDEARVLAARFFAVDAVTGHYMLGDIADAEGDPGSALRQYLAALEKGGGHETAWTITNQLQFAGLDEDAYTFRVTQRLADLGGVNAAYTGHREAALRQMQAMLQRRGNEATANVIAGEVEMVLGRRREAKRYFDRAWRLGKGRTSDFAPAFLRSELITYAALLLQAGESAKAKRLLDEVRANAAKLGVARLASGVPSDGYQEFRLASVEILSGDRDHGLSLLARAAARLRMELPFMPTYVLQMPFFLERAPRFDAVRGDARFRAILKDSEREQARRRAQILPVICGWKFPKGGWHPQPATCAGVTQTEPAASAGQAQ